MQQLRIAVVKVFEVTRNGKPLGFGTSVEDAKREVGIRRLAQSTIITEKREAAGVIEGRFVRWHNDPERGVKLHWTCPNCGHEHWGAWTTSESAPCVWYSECNCVDKWLITWTPENEQEMKKARKRSTKTQNKRGKEAGKPSRAVKGEKK